MKPALIQLIEEHLADSLSFHSPFSSSSPLSSLEASFKKKPGERMLGVWFNEDSSETRVFVLSSCGLRISRREEASRITFQYLPFDEIAKVHTKSGAPGMPERICLQRKSGAETWLRASGQTKEDETPKMVAFLTAIAETELGQEEREPKAAILTLETNLLPPAKNPRNSPFWTGYRADLRIPGGITPLRLKSTILLEKRKSVKAGDKFRCRSYIAEEELLPHHLIPGDTIYLEENKQRIGEAKIIESSHFGLTPGKEHFQILYELQNKIHQSTPYWHRFESIIEIKGGEIRRPGDFYAALESHSSRSYYKPQDLDSLWKWLCHDLNQPTLFLWNQVEQSAIFLKKNLSPILEVLHQSIISDLRFRL